MKISSQNKGRERERLMDCDGGGVDENANKKETQGCYSKFHIQPATLLTEPLSQPGGDYSRRFGVKLADFMASVIVFRVSQIGITSLGLTPRRVHRTRFDRPRPPVQPVHKIVLRRREISPTAQIQPNPRREVRNRFALRRHHVPAVLHRGSADVVERQHRWRRRRVGDSEGAWVVERVRVGLGLGVVERLLWLMKVVLILRKPSWIHEGFVESLSVVIENLAVRVGISGGFFAGVHDCWWVSPFVLQHCFKTQNPLHWLAFTTTLWSVEQRKQEK